MVNKKQLEYRQKTAIGLLKDLQYLQSSRGMLFTDIGILVKAQRKNSKLTQTQKNKLFIDFKRNYSELFNGVLRKFDKQNVGSMLGSFRRAYNEGKKSKIEIHEKVAIRLEKAYKDKKEEKIIIDDKIFDKDLNLKQILSRYGLGVVMHEKTYYETIIPAQTKNIQKFLQRIKLQTREIKYLREEGIYNWQLIVKVVFDKGKSKTVLPLGEKPKSRGFYSTKYQKLNNFQEFVNYITHLDEFIINQTYYEYQEVSEVIKYYEEVIIHWK